MAHKLLTDKILPLVFNKGESKFVACKLDLNSVGEDQMQSSVVFLTAVVTNGDERKEIPLVVKFEPTNETVRTYLRTDVQFYVEVLLYEQFLPLLNRQNIVQECFAKFYHGVGSDKNKVVVLEDLRPRGYRLAKEKAFMDYDHLALAMAKLGKFHALSFAAKNDTPNEFFNLVKSLKESSWVEDNPFYYVIKSCVHRAVDPIIKKGKHVEVLKRFLDRIDDSVCNFMLDLVTSEEPLAVLCHGDFCRNNILFKYTEGKPTNVKFFDVATARYSSTMIDISFFLLLNSSPQVRQAHLEDLLTIYHQALSTAVPGTTVPSLEDIKEEFSKKALYGFMHCSFFLPIMYFDENPFSDLDSICESEEEMAQGHLAVGGDAGTKLLSDMVEELVERGCLSMQHSFLQSR
ncbi:uncharacterized protein LOC124365744 [Homalodisca vitripennis]|uniref:uncharacterized protein LOC124365744 n=1 Tax=Homalodisca vitripennis TaxID=197043 RepID=UPI001EEA5582|nr:uncharacterized protein LOC124365744 [Homalodisca vitripennis]KAG8278122.1 hypothetical protein J6590_027378 [Homalodisca vitripennis]